VDFGPITALLAIQLSNSILQYRCSDDLIAFLPKKLSHGKLRPFKFVNSLTRITLEFYSSVTYQTVKALNVEVDFVTDEAQKGLGPYFRNPSISKILSVQNILGTNENGVRNLQAKFAWMTLNLRLSWFTLAAVLRHNEALRPGRLVKLLRFVPHLHDTRGCGCSCRTCSILNGLPRVYLARAFRHVLQD